MKEKEIDVYLSLALFCQVLIVGGAGTFVTEFMKSDPAMEIEYLSGFISIAGIVGAIGIYAKIFEQLSDKS